MKSNPNEEMPYYTMAGADYSTEQVKYQHRLNPWNNSRQPIMDIERQKHFGTLGSFEVQVEYLDTGKKVITRIENKDRLGALALVNRLNRDTRSYLRPCKYTLL